ncbi:MAG: iron transporter [Thermoanaerobaculia bacterium]
MPQGEETHGHVPPMESSEEASSKQLTYARRQGDTLQDAIDAMLKMDRHSQERRAGEFLVSCVVEDAEGMWVPRDDGALEWEEPDEQNLHVEVLVRDGADRRFIPGLRVTLTLIGPDGNEIGTHEQPFLWHPWLFHYGRNWKVPGDGEYRARIHIDAPSFARHDHRNGKRYARPVDVELGPIHVETGRKAS